MKKSLLAAIPAAATTAFIAGMAVVPNTFAVDTLPTACNADVTNEAAFSTALSNPKCTTIQLNGKIELTTPATISKELTIDLNGQTLTRAAANQGSVVVLVDTGGDLTVNNGKGGGKIINSRTNPGDAAIGMQGTNPKLTVNGGTIQGTSAGIGAVTGVSGESITVNGGTIIGANGIGLSGANATLNIGGNAIIEATSNAINANATDTSNTTINISGGNISSTGAAAIYMPQSGTLNITGGNLTGYVGVVSRAGKVLFSGGKITATGTDPVQIGDAEGVTFPGGVAVIVDNKTPGYGDDAAAIIGVNAVIDAKNTEYGPVLAYESDAPGTEITIQSGATFEGSKPDAAYLGEGLAIAPNGVVMTEAEAEAMAAEMNRPATSAHDETNPDTADSIALYATIATVALLGLGATALIARKANRK